MENDEFFSLNSNQNYLIIEIIRKNQFYIYKDNFIYFDFMNF